MKTDLPKDLNPAHPVHPSLSSRAQALIDQAALDRKALEPLLSVPKTPEPSPIAAPLPVPGYTHTAMVELMVANPDWNHRKLAAHWGRNSSWFASVLASDAFQLELDKRRGEIVDRKSVV